MWKKAKFIISREFSPLSDVRGSKNYRTKIVYNLLDRFWNEYNNNALTQSYSDLVVPTGISYPIIITDIDGNVSVGDELVAYANGQVVGATRIADLTAPVVISAWGGFNEYGIYIEGCLL